MKLKGGFFSKYVSVRFDYCNKGCIYSKDFYASLSGVQLSVKNFNCTVEVKHYHIFSKILINSEYPDIESSIPTLKKGKIK